MQDKEKVIVEIMGLVSAYGSAVEATVLSEGHSREEHKEFRAYKLVESRLRELVKQNTAQEPLSDDEIEDLLGEANRGFDIEAEHYFKAFRDAERAYGILKDTNA